MTPITPKKFDEPHRDIFSHLHYRALRGSADHESSYHIRDQGTPDSPISQVKRSRVQKSSFFNCLQSKIKHFLSSTTQIYSFFQMFVFFKKSSSWATFKYHVTLCNRHDKKKLLQKK